MLNRAEDFLEQCLSGIPEGKYERRLRKELEGHLAALEADLTDAGYSQEEARAEAIRRMGDPAALNESYRAEWRRRPERFGHDLMACFCCSLLAGICYVSTSVALILFLHLWWAVHPYEFSFQMINDAALWTLFGVGLFLGTYLTDAALLRNHFRLRKDRRGLVTAGLLMTWAGEKAVVLLVSSLLYGIPLTALPELVGTMARDSDFSYNLPWFSAPYCVWTLFGCLPLGRLFGGGERERHRQAA